MTYLQGAKCQVYRKGFGYPTGFRPHVEIIKVVNMPTYPLPTQFKQLQSYFTPKNDLKLYNKVKPTATIIYYTIFDEPVFKFVVCAKKSLHCINVILLSLSIIVIMT